MTVSITRAHALTWRMRRQFLFGTRAKKVDDVVARLVAVPAWSGDADRAIGMRLADPVADTVAGALAEGRILKTFTFRGSMQLHTPGDAGIPLALRAMGRQWERKSWREFYKLEPDDWPDFRAVVRDALRPRPLTRSELADAVARHGRFAHLRDAVADRSFTLIKPLAWQGDLSLGPVRDGEHTLQALDGTPGWNGIPDLDDAGPNAIIAYLGAYGPATPERVHYWLGEGLSVPRRQLTEWIARVQDDRVTSIAVDGQPMLCRIHDVADLTSTRPSDHTVRLPGLDPWILGPGTADTFVVPSVRRAEITRGANPVLTGGTITGTWKPGVP